MFRYIVLCFDDIVLCFNNAVLCFDNIVMCFDNTVLCFGNSLLCSDNTMLCLEKCLLCFKNCLLCLQIWATVLHTFVLTQMCHSPSPMLSRAYFWSTEMTANPNQHWGGRNHTSVSRFVTSIVFSRN